MDLQRSLFFHVFRHNTKKVGNPSTYRRGYDVNDPSIRLFDLAERYNQEKISMKWKTDDGGWSPYLAGALVGLRAIASVYATTQWLGKSSYLEHRQHSYVP